MNLFNTEAVLLPEVLSLCLYLNHHNFHPVVLNRSFGAIANISNQAYMLSVQYLRVTNHFLHFFSYSILNSPGIFFPDLSSLQPLLFR